MHCENQKFIGETWLIHEMSSLTIWVINPRKTIWLCSFLIVIMQGFVEWMKNVLTTLMSSQLMTSHVHCSTVSKRRQSHSEKSFEQIIHGLSSKESEHNEIDVTGQTPVQGINPVSASTIEDIENNYPEDRFTLSTNTYFNTTWFTVTIIIIIIYIIAGSISSSSSSSSGVSRSTMNIMTISKRRPSWWIQSMHGMSAWVISSLAMHGCSKIEPKFWIFLKQQSR